MLDIHKTRPAVPGGKPTERPDKNISGDSKVYESYRECINESYPSFLNKLGLNHIAVRAEGAVITDSQGKEYIDCVGGYGVSNIGHNHPALIRSLVDQLYQKDLATRPLLTEHPVRLARALSSLTGGDLTSSFLCNSGSEAIDNALKLARLHKGKKQIIAAHGSFHGYTCGALSVSGIPSFKRLFEPLLPDVEHVPFGDGEALKNKVSDRTAAVLLEPVQHEAGVVLPSRDYFQEVRRVCDDRGILLIFDEIKTGLGKTGKMFAFEHFDIIPDVLVLGKSLGGGLIPIGALVARKSLWKKFGLSFSMSASSYSWNTLACKAALATVDIIQQNKLIPECAEKGRFLLNEMNDIAGRHPRLLRSASGIGLLIGLATAHPRIATELCRELIRRGVLSVPAFGNASVLMFEPPLVISFEQTREIIQAIEKSCETVSEREQEEYADLQKVRH